MRISTYDLERLQARRGGVAHGDVVERFCMVGENAGKPGPCPGGGAGGPAPAAVDDGDGPKPKTKQEAETALLGTKYKLSHAKNALAKAPTGSEMETLLKGKVASLSAKVDSLSGLAGSLPDQPHPESYLANKKVLAVKSNISKTAKALKDPALTKEKKAALEEKLKGLKTEEAAAQKAKKDALAKEKGGKAPPSVAKVVDLAPPPAGPDLKSLDDAVTSTMKDYIKAMNGDPAEKAAAKAAYDAAVKAKADSMLPDVVKTPPLSAPAPAAKPPFNPFKMAPEKQAKIKELNDDANKAMATAKSYPPNDPMHQEFAGKAKDLATEKEALLAKWKAEWESGVPAPSPKAPGTAGLPDGTSVAAVVMAGGKPVALKPGHQFPGHDFEGTDESALELKNKKHPGDGVYFNPYLPQQARDFQKVSDPAIREAVGDYTGQSYYSLNSALYGGKPLKGYALKTHEGLQKAFAATKTFDKPVEVLRGIPGNDYNKVKGIVDKVKEAYEGKKPLVFDGYASTSTKSSSALGFSYGGSATPAVVFKIRAVRGLDVKTKYNDNAGEDELLLNAGSQFDVRDVRFDKKQNRYVVFMDQRRDEGFAEGDDGVHLQLDDHHERVAPVLAAIDRTEAANDDDFGVAADLAEWLNGRRVSASQEEAAVLASRLAGTGLALVVDDGEWTVEEVDYGRGQGGAGEGQGEDAGRAVPQSEGTGEGGEEGTPRVEVPASGAKAATDLDAAERLTDGATRAGARILAAVTREAVERHGLAAVAGLDSLFDEGERERIAESIASTNATADLMGRARVRLRAQTANVRKHSEPTDFSVFGEGPIKPMAPEAALTYFKDLVPAVGVRDPEKFAKGKRREAFTLAVDADKAVLERVQAAIARAIGEGLASDAARTIDRVLDDAGLSTKNPQYAEMVYRTNAKDAYNEGSDEERQDPEVAETFPVWKYVGIEDGRQRHHHAVHFDRYFPNSVKFAEVRDSAMGKFDGFNCRCDQIPISKWEWRDLQRAGARLAGGYDSFAERLAKFRMEDQPWAS